MFSDRCDAGIALAKKLLKWKSQSNLIVLALPRGGLPVGYEVAKQLSCPLDIIVVRKLGVPGREELAFGAIASGGITVFNNEIVNALNLTKREIDEIRKKQQAEVTRREKLYRKEFAALQLSGKTALLVDDGMATGATMKAALKAVLTQGAAKVIVAIPVASLDACEEIENNFSNVECVCCSCPEPFWGVGRWYNDFRQLNDEDVNSFLKLNRQETSKDTRELSSISG